MFGCIATCGALLLITMELVEYPIKINEFLSFRMSTTKFPSIFIFQSHNAGNAILEIADPLVMLSLAFVPVAMTCELTGQMSIGFDGIYDEIIKIKWFLWPLKTQKLLLIFLPNAQQPVRFECYGSISSDRDTLKRVRSANTNNKPHT